MNVDQVAPIVDPDDILAGAHFSDAFRIEIDGPALDARTAAERMMGRSPRWVEALLRLRNIAVRPFGLKTGGSHGTERGDAIGIFPVVSETPARLIAGFDDKHLDFRVVVDVARSGSRQQVTATTLVRKHNWLGRIYLAIILPFHRLVVPAMLRQVAR
jgi:hypothetical protein